MRKYVLPTVIFSAIAALIVVIVRMADEGEPDKQPEAPVTSGEGGGTEQPKDWRDQGRETRVGLDENQWLSELERSLDRGDLSNAHYFRQKVCEQIATISQDEELASALLALIREKGVEGDDPRARDVTLPILRVFEHPGATALIEQEYFQARDAKERMMLLDAMSREYHDPEKASVWAIELALNAESADDRQRALELIYHNGRDESLMNRTAIAIYGGSTRPEQRSQALRSLSDRGWEQTANRFLHERMQNPREEEIVDVIVNVANWGDEDDIARLERLAEEFPARREVIGEISQQLRTAVRERKGQPPEDPVPERVGKTADSATRDGK